jgi:hypothetical protein
MRRIQNLPGHEHTFLAPADAFTLLRDLEKLLVELGSLGVESYRRRLELEAQISEIRRDVAMLASRFQK